MSPNLPNVAVAVDVATVFISLCCGGGVAVTGAEGPGLDDFHSSGSGSFITLLSSICGHCS